jgi:hypothetical protein
MNSRQSLAVCISLGLVVAAWAVVVVVRQASSGPEAEWRQNRRDIESKKATEESLSELKLSWRNLQDAVTGSGRGVQLRMGMYVAIAFVVCMLVAAIVKSREASAEIAAAMKGPLPTTDTDAHRPFVSRRGGRAMRRLRIATDIVARQVAALDLGRRLSETGKQAMRGVRAAKDIVVGKAAAIRLGRRLSGMKRAIGESALSQGVSIPQMEKEIVAARSLQQRIHGANQQKHELSRALMENSVGVVAVVSVACVVCGGGWFAVSGIFEKGRAAANRTAAKDTLPVAAKPADAATSGPPVSEKSKDSSSAELAAQFPSVFGGDEAQTGTRGESTKSAMPCEVDFDYESVIRAYLNENANDRSKLEVVRITSPIPSKGSCIYIGDSIPMRITQEAKEVDGSFWKDVDESGSAVGVKFRDATPLGGMRLSVVVFFLDESGRVTRVVPAEDFRASRAPFRTSNVRLWAEYWRNQPMESKYQPRPNAAPKSAP